MEAPKKILIIKTSSLGDVIHTLPALTDCAAHYPDVEFHWLVEDAYKDIALWHPRVTKVIPVQIRKWRKNPINSLFSTSWKTFRQEIAAENYHAIIDAQGLIKSAILAPMASGHRYGYDKSSVREPLARHFYQSTIKVAKQQHAVERTRQLFAKALDYQLPSSVGDYGIKSHFNQSNTDSKQTPYLVFLHGTTWQTKHYPEQYWEVLIALAATDGLDVKLLWGNDDEYQRAQQLSAGHHHVDVMPKLALAEIADLLIKAKAAISVDTGLGHLAAAVDCPSLSLFSATNPNLTGTYGQSQRHLKSTLSCSPCLNKKCALLNGKINLDEAEVYEQNINPPCFSTLPPEDVWLNLQLLFQHDD